MNDHPMIERHERQLQRFGEADGDILVAGSVVFNDRASVAENMRALRESLARVALDA
jgi:pentose-5-phosphate-3-epimerase